MAVRCGEGNQLKYLPWPKLWMDWRTPWSSKVEVQKDMDLLPPNILKIKLSRMLIYPCTQHVWNLLYVRAWQSSIILFRMSAIRNKSSKASPLNNFIQKTKMKVDFLNRHPPFNWQNSAESADQDRVRHVVGLTQVRCSSEVERLLMDVKKVVTHLLLFFMIK